MMIEMESIMATRKFERIDSKGHTEVWEWEETPEVAAAVAKLHKNTKLELKAPDYGVGK